MTDSFVGALGVFKWLVITTFTLLHPIDLNESVEICLKQQFDI